MYLFLTQRLVLQFLFSIFDSEDNFISANSVGQKTKFHGCFLGSQFIAWTVDHGQAKDKTDAIELGEQLLKVGILRAGGF